MPRPAQSADQYTRALEQLFLREGMAALTIGDIASRMRCSRRRLYQQGSSKEDLFLNAMDGVLRRLRSEGDAAAAAAADSFAKVTDFLEVGVRAMHAMSPACLADIQASAAGRNLFIEHQRIRRDGLKQLVAAGVAQGVFGDFHPQFIAEAVASIAKRLLEPDFYRDTEITVEEAYASMSRFLRGGLSAGHRNEISLRGHVHK